MIAWATGTVFAVSFLFGLVLLIRGPIARTFGARAAYALWLAPGLRAVMPSLPAAVGPLPASQSLGPINHWVVQAAAPDAGWMALPVILGTIWLGGAILLLGFHGWRHYRFLGQALAQGHPLDIPDVPYDVVASAHVAGPLATGLIHRLIIVPADFEQRFSVDQQRLALWHEQLHHRRGDIWASAAALILTSLLWFNPLAYLALRAFRRDMEAACDECLLAEAGQSAASTYAQTILRCAARPVPRSLCALTTIDELKGRLTMLKTNHGRGRRLTGLLLAGGISIAGLALATPAAADGGAPPRLGPEKTQIFINKTDVPELAKAPRPANCERAEDRFEVDLSSGSAAQDQLMYYVCNQGKTSADMVAALEQALNNIGKDGELSAAHREKIVPLLQAEITRRKAAL